jgi:hypothetical protein
MCMFHRVRQALGGGWPENSAIGGFRECRTALQELGLPYPVANGDETGHFDTAPTRVNRAPSISDMWGSCLAPVAAICGGGP